jgi:putative tricarboxylic transport membrane protein
MRRLNRTYGLFSVMAISLVLVVAATANGANPAADYPTKPIELVTHQPPGGSMALLGRLIDKIMKEEKILDQPLIVVHKQGSGAGVALGYVFERKGNPHVLLAVGSNSFLDTPLRENVPYTYKSFIPVCNLIADGSVLVVRNDSPFKTIDDLIAEARKRPKQLNQSGSSFVSNESLMGKSIQKVKGVQWDYISFPGDAEATLAVLGGHADFQFVNPSGIIEHVKAGKLRVLLTGAPARYDEFKDVPTIKEAGLGDPITLYRGIAGPPDMPEYAVKKLEAAFKRVMGNPQVKKYTDDALMQPFWLSSKEYGAFLDEENVRYKGWLEELKLLKKK